MTAIVENSDYSDGVLFHLIKDTMRKTSGGIKMETMAFAMDSSNLSQTADLLLNLVEEIPACACLIFFIEMKAVMQVLLGFLF